MTKEPQVPDLGLDAPLDFVFFAGPCSSQNGLLLKYIGVEFLTAVSKVGLDLT